MKISVHFDQLPTVEIIVDDTETGRQYFALTKKQNEQQQPFYQDTSIYTPEYMIGLAHRAQQAFNWDWFSDQYDISKTAQLHKDLENYVGRLGFDQIPEEYDKLLYDLHHCLHAIQFGPGPVTRPDNFQIEWFTDASVALPMDFEFKESTDYGDLILINPYVGHNPLQIYRENDFTSLATTCCFHDVVKPGIVITNEEAVSKNVIVNKFRHLVPEFVELHGEDKIRYYAGAAVIGHVVDLDVFDQVKRSDSEITLIGVEFDE